MIGMDASFLDGKGERMERPPIINNNPQRAIFVGRRVANRK